VIRGVLTDIGGVLLTNGWDHHARDRAVERFGIEPKEFSDRHHVLFSAYEEGRITLAEYLDFVVFHEPRYFGSDEFVDFMLDQSQPHVDTLALFRRVKECNQARIVTVSNEGRELADHRLQRFGLREFVDCFVVSGFVGVRKPDPQIFRVALDIAQLEPEECIYVEDRQMFVEAATSFGLRSIWHKDAETTANELREAGLEL
jgi:putative hydrolase of the HAD superfamily